jgi:hypothetical protein
VGREIFILILPFPIYSSLTSSSTVCSKITKWLNLKETGKSHETGKSSRAKEHLFKKPMSFLRGNSKNNGFRRWSGISIGSCIFRSDSGSSTGFDGGNPRASSFQEALDVFAGETQQTYILKKPRSST